MRRAAVGLVVLTLLAGCAAMVPAPATAPAPAAERPAPTAARTAPDSTPSADAQRVLASIPEPIAPADRFAPGDRAAGDTLTRHMRVPASAYDTLRLAPSSMTDSIPVPAPTRPMMEPAPLTVAPPDTVPHAPAAPPPVTPPGHPAQPGPGAKKADCWRLQVAAPAGRARAQEMKSAAESQLLLPMTLKFEGKHWKVRTRDCMDRESADRLKARASASGFRGVFLVHVAAGR